MRRRMTAEEAAAAADPVDHVSSLDTHGVKETHEIQHKRKKKKKNKAEIRL